MGLNSMDERVRAVMSLMDSSFHQELSLEHMAQTVNLSSSYLSHLFKAETGISPLQYLKSLRIRKAKELLDSTYLNIKQIMNRVGVRDKCNFAKDLRRAYGLTPAQYKAHCRRGLTAKAEFTT
jgi:AraC family transcriptional regulator of arabinose operon